MKDLTKVYQSRGRLLSESLNGETFIIDDSVQGRIIPNIDLGFRTRLDEVTLKQIGSYNDTYFIVDVGMLI